MRAFQNCNSSTLVFSGSERSHTVSDSLLYLQTERESAPIQQKSSYVFRYNTKQKTAKYQHCSRLVTVLIRNTYCVLSRKGRPVSPLSQPLVHLPSHFAQNWHFVVHFVYYHAWNGVLVWFNQNKPEVCVIRVISVKGTVVPSILGKSKHPPWS